jgi:hypothetical protein
MPFSHREPVQFPDGIRDPLGWSRFAAPRMLVVGTALWVIVSLVSAGDPAARTAGEAVRAAHRVVAVALRVAADVSVSDVAPSSDAAPQ